MFDWRSSLGVLKRQKKKKNINEDCDGEELISNETGLQYGGERHAVELFTQPERTVRRPEPD